MMTAPTEPTAEARAAALLLIHRIWTEPSTRWVDRRKEAEEWATAALDAFAKERVEQEVSKGAAAWDRADKITAARIASLEAELARVRDMGTEMHNQLFDATLELDAVKARLSPERLKKVARAVATSDSHEQRVLAVLQRELGQ